MNYYEHHIGDYAEATGHLTFVEDAAYSRMIRKYYAMEKPLPADVKAVQRLVGARSREEKKAVDDVLQEFFSLADDGWHQERCDEVIALYKAGEPEREVRKLNEETRLKRHREERAKLFKALYSVGQHPAYNISITVLRQLHERYCNSLETKPETLQPPLHVTAPTTLATATHSPVPNTQFPIPNPQSYACKSDTRENDAPETTETDADKNQIPPRLDSDASGSTGIADDLTMPDGWFEQVQAEYPKFLGANNWLMAEPAAILCVEKYGGTWDSILETVRKYARHCASGGVSSPQYVITPHTFFTRADKPWQQDWQVVPTKADQRQQENIDASLEWLNRPENQHATG